MTAPADRAYKNARRAGKTQPGKIELLDALDPRRAPKRFTPNRADLRARGHRGPSPSARVRPVGMPFRKERRAAAKRGRR